MERRYKQGIGQQLDSNCPKYIGVEEVERGLYQEFGRRRLRRRNASVRNVKQYGLRSSIHLVGGHPVICHLSSCHRMLAEPRMVDFVVLNGKRARGSPDGKRSPPPINICNTKGIAGYTSTSATNDSPPRSPFAVATPLAFNLLNVNIDRKPYSLVLITKLRSANTLETEQYRKATKALLVLIPLLGITNLLVLCGPSDDSWFADAFDYTRALMLSTQGFTVALFYCFMNTEVRHAIRYHVERWKTGRAIAGGRRRGASCSKDWSPRSRTESIRTKLVL
ncbi:hypothetical protein MSG28_001802 [Choristoneura fumiferana]|uniref:Uncharacterized protein n=1 Tax=Choristoneura fumiferana TaxID=7141 RepID=A0ACC0KW71_CHOFU|nr:hypothetical protein MSG28_001802 [Choristoneura fumiferana]